MSIYPSRQTLLKENSVQSWAQVRKIDDEKRLLKGAAAALELILQLEGDKQVLQASLIRRGGGWH
jgi:hypothetical protein